MTREGRLRAAARIGAVGVVLTVLALAGIIYISVDLIEFATDRADDAERHAQMVENRLDRLEEQSREADRLSVKDRREITAIAVENRRALCRAVKVLTPMSRPQSAPALVDLSKDLGCPVPMPDFTEPAAEPSPPPKAPRASRSTPDEGRAVGGVTATAPQPAPKSPPRAPQAPPKPTKPPKPPTSTAPQKSTAPGKSASRGRPASPGKSAGKGKRPK